jgi:hypothetical protein
MLGGLFAERLKPSSNTRLQFKQSIKNEVYIDHLYSLFNNYCCEALHLKLQLLWIKDQKKLLLRREINVSKKFWTLSLPCFNKFRELFYDKAGVKFIPNNLEDFITNRSLAYWCFLF